MVEASIELTLEYPNDKEMGTLEHIAEELTTQLSQQLADANLGDIKVQALVCFG